MSILAEPPVTVVDKVANKRKTAAVAKAYLEFLYTPQGQEIAAKHYYRPRLPAVAQMLTYLDTTGDYGWIYWAAFVLTALVLSFLATLYPAWKASRMVVADALRHGR